MTAPALTGAVSATLNSLPLECASRTYISTVAVRGVEREGENVVLHLVVVATP
jgi:hypothetical protein